MKTTTGINDKTLLKILLGIAWIDGILEPGEKDYLHRLAQQKGLASDRSGINSHPSPLWFPCQLVSKIGQFLAGALQQLTHSRSRKFSDNIRVE